MIERIARRYEGRWLQGYARGKLRGDPVFAAAFELLKDAPLPVLDICGQRLAQIGDGFVVDRTELVGDALGVG